MVNMDDPLRRMALEAQEELIEHGEENLTEWQRALVLHNWAATRIEQSNAQLLEECVELGGSPKRGKEMLKASAPVAGVGFGIGTLAAYAKDVFNFISSLI